METWFGVLGALVLIASINRFNEWRRERREEKAKQQFNEESMKNDTQNEEVQKPDTIGLMFKTLSNIGCQPAKNEDGTLTVSYQGENFHMEFGGIYVRVWDPGWAFIKADDPDIPIAREAVNATNFNFGPTVVLTRPNDEGIIRFHTRRDIMFHPACPDNEPFVKAVLESFFDAKEDVHRYFQQMKTNQHEAPQSRRPVGFATDNQNQS